MQVGTRKSAKEPSSISESAVQCILIVCIVDPQPANPGEFTRHVLSGSRLDMTHQGLV